MRLTLVRHGETTGQSSIRYYGATDVPLSDTGREQMQRVRVALGNETFDAVYSSRLCRSAEAAAIIGGSAVTRLAGFDEVNFGRWEGWTREEIIARDGDNYRLWQSGGQQFAYPEGESRSAFDHRVATALTDVLRDRREQHLLIVVHKGVIAVILTKLLGLTAAQRATLGIELASIHVVAGREGRWEAHDLNRTDHLEGLNL